MVLTMGTECTVNYHRPYGEPDDRQIYGSFLYASNAPNEVNVQGQAPYAHPLKMPHPPLNVGVIGAEAQTSQPQGPAGTTDQTECTTPEIIQNLMNLSGPFDQASQQTSAYYQEQQTDLATTPLGPNPGSVPSSTHNYGQPVTSSPPMASCAVSPAISSVQVTKHQLVMEDLKHRLKQRRPNMKTDSSPLDPMQLNSDELTPEDEERRKRRRERNKIAATKCRNKKKERTMNLIWESQHLEVQNNNLKGEVQKLEAELRQLKSYLSSHQCSMQRRPYYEQQGRSSCMAL